MLVRSRSARFESAGSFETSEMLRVEAYDMRIVMLTGTTGLESG